MAGKIEKVKGHVEEAVGVLTNKKDLESKGKADRRAGEAKEKIGRAEDSVEKVAKLAESKAGKVIDKAKAKAKGASRHK